MRQDTDLVLYPNATGTSDTEGLSRRRLLTSSAAAGAAATAGCVGGEGVSEPSERPCSSSTPATGP